MTEKQQVVVTGEPVARRQKVEEPTKTYKLREGARHFMDGEAVGPDEEVALTDAEFTAFADKFVPTGKTSTSRRSGKLPEGVEDVEPIRAGSDELNAPPPVARGVDHNPQDIGAKTPDLGAPQANPGNAMRGGPHGPRVAGGVPVRAEALQSSGEAVKGEDKPGKDGPVQSGQIAPSRSSVEATVAGGVATAVQQQAESSKADKADKADKKDK